MIGIISSLFINDLKCLFVLYGKLRYLRLSSDMGWKVGEIFYLFFFDFGMLK